MDEMTDKPKRPTLRLKFPPKLPDPPAAEKPAAQAFDAKPFDSRPFGPKPFAGKPFAGRPSAPKAPPPPAVDWKCKPCGTGFNVPAELADDEAVRCPSCNAKLGLAGDFRQDPPNTPRLRARPVAKG
jgi:hypothetical protein